MDKHDFTKRGCIFSYSSLKEMFHTSKTEIYGCTFLMKTCFRRALPSFSSLHHDNNKPGLVKINFFGTRKSVHLKGNLGERSAPRNFMLLVSQDVHVYVAVHQII